MICLKIRTFVVSATTYLIIITRRRLLWFAWKFVPLWYQQQPTASKSLPMIGCDLLENSYLCGISNNYDILLMLLHIVVICLKIRTFVVSATTKCINFRGWHLLWFAWKFVPLWYQQQLSISHVRIAFRCDLLENSYLCGISNNGSSTLGANSLVVICLKIRTFVVSATTVRGNRC